MRIPKFIRNTYRKHIRNIRWTKLLFLPFKLLWSIFNSLTRPAVVLSHSKVSLYLICPLKYKYIYIERREQRPNKYLSFGSSIHKTLYHFHKEYDIKNTEFTTLLNIYNKCWLSEGYESKEEEEKFKQRGEKILLDYFNDNKDMLNKPIKLEESITINIPGITLTGVVDRIDQTLDDKLEIIDYKTSKKTFTENSIKSNLQASIYYMLTNEKYKDVSCFYFYFLSTRQRIRIKLREKEVESIKKLLKDVKIGIQDGKFKPKKSPLCGWCEFQIICPAWKGYVTDKSKFRLSYSKIHTFLLCPFNYKAIYIDGIPTSPKPFFSLGTSIHKTLEEFYNYNGYLRQPSLKYLLKLFNKHWISIGYSDDEEEKKYYEDGIKMLTDYYHTFVDGNYRRAYMTEAYFEIPFDDYIFVGFIDRIEKLPDGSFEVIDYKTEPSLPTQQELKDDLQLPIYYWACKEYFGIVPEKLSFHYLRFNKKISIKKTDEDIKPLIDRIIEIAEKMRSEKKFEPKINKYCDSCDFQINCALIKEPKVSLDVFDSIDQKEYEVKTVSLLDVDEVTEPTQPRKGA